MQGGKKECECRRDGEVVGVDNGVRAGGLDEEGFRVRKRKERVGENGRGRRARQAGRTEEEV